MPLRIVDATELQHLAQLLRSSSRELSPKTRIEYAADWKSFVQWCARHRHTPLPVEPSVALNYLHDLIVSGHKVSTARRHSAAINSYHRAAALALPIGTEARNYLLAVKRLRGERPAQKRPISIEQLRAMCRHLPETRRGVRNRAILTLGFASALRRSNLAALDLADVEVTPKGLLLAISREKQDRKGDGRMIGVAHARHREICAVVATEQWIAARGSGPGPLFTRDYSGQAGRLRPPQIAMIVKRAVESIGLDPALYGGHSLRSGFVTAAIEANVNETLVASQTGHRSLENLRQYFRRTDPFRANPSAMIGL